MMFARVAAVGRGAGLAASRRVAGGSMGMSTAARGGSSLQAFSRVAFKSNAAYITYIVAGCVVSNFIYDNVLDGIWDSVNKGKQYKDIDWSKFKMEDEDEEEEEEEEDDE